MHKRFRIMSIEWVLLLSSILILGAFIALTFYRERTTIEQLERDRLMGQARVVNDNISLQLAGIDRACQRARRD